MRVCLKNNIWVDLDPEPKSCRGCGATMYWGTTDRGKKIPVVMQAHFVDCPKAEEFRVKGFKE